MSTAHAPLDFHSLSPLSAKAWKGKSLPENSKSMPLHWWPLLFLRFLLPCEFTHRPLLRGLTGRPLSNLLLVSAINESKTRHCFPAPSGSGESMAVSLKYPTALSRVLKMKPSIGPAKAFAGKKSSCGPGVGAAGILEQGTSIVPYLMGVPNLASAHC